MQTLLYESTDWFAPAEPIKSFFLFLICLEIYYWFLYNRNLPVLDVDERNESQRRNTTFSFSWEKNFGKEEVIVWMI